MYIKCSVWGGGGRGGGNLVFLYCAIARNCANGIIEDGIFLNDFQK